MRRTLLAVMFLGVALARPAGLSAARGASASQRSDPFLDGLKATVARTAAAAFAALQETRVRNRHYSIALVEKETLGRLSEQRESLERPGGIPAAAPEVRRLVLQESRDFLDELSHEVKRLARESSSASEFATNLERISEQIATWSGRAPTNPKARMIASDAKSDLTNEEKIPTEDNIEGPFYRPNAPWTDTLFSPQDAGERLVVSGQVLAEGGSPLPGAVVDIWLATAEGEYDIANPRDRENPAIPYRWRGRLRADAQGRYRYEAILPGQYEIGGGRWRPKHIHSKVSAPGHRFLTTQIYFEGDRYNEVDPWWKPALTAPLIRSDPADPKSTLTLRFDYVLRRTL